MNGEQRIVMCQGCRDGIDRREFLERTIAAMGLSALAACASDPTAVHITQFTVMLSTVPALTSVGGVALVNGGGATIAVARTGASSFVALSLVCPHRGVTIEISGAGFYCPGHGAMFAESGTWTGGQPTSNMSAYNCVYNASAGTLVIG